MIPKSSKALLRVYLMEESLCVAMVLGFSFSEWNHAFKKETFTLLLCKHELVLLHPQKAEQQYCKKVNILIR